MCKNCNCPECRAYHRTYESRENNGHYAEKDTLESRSFVITTILKCIGFVLVCVGVIAVGRAAYNRVFTVSVEERIVALPTSESTEIATSPPTSPVTELDAWDMVNRGFSYLWPPFNASHSHDCDTAIYWFTKAAEFGLAHAQSILGQLYGGCDIMTIRTCTCAPIDIELSVYWYRLAASQYDSEGLVGLGVAYRDGITVEQDLYAAIRLFRLAAGRGYNTSAMNHLGVSYLRGDGVEQSYERALFWIRQSAEGWNDFGMYSLGHMYEHGHGTERDVELAIYWYDKVAWRIPDAAIALTRLRSEVGAGG